MRQYISGLLLCTYFLLSAGISNGADKWTHYYSGNDITDMAVCGDSLWCATRGSAVQWNIRNKMYTQFPNSTSMPYTTFYTTIGADGSPWVINFSDPLFLSHLTGTGWTQYNGFNFSASTDRVTSLCRDHDGDIWAGTNARGVFRFDGSSWQQYSASDVPIITPRVMTADGSGAVWIGSADGLYRFYQGNWRHFSTQDGLAGNSINCLLAAPDGAIWAGTGNGVSRFVTAGWKTYRMKDGLPSNGINAITADRTGKVWLGTDNGVSCFDGAAWTAWKGDAEYFINPKVTGVAADASNRIWMSHRGIDEGVTVFDGVQWKWYTTFNTDIPTNNIESVASGSDGVLWIATDRGALRYDGESWKTYTTGEGLASNTIKEVIVDRNNIVWFLFPKSENAGVTRLDSEGTFTFSTTNGLPDNTVLTITAASDGVLWFGTTEGVTGFDGHSWKKYPETDRLLSPRVSGIAEDSNGVLWFATGHGLTRFDGAKWQTFTLGDDANSDEIAAISLQENGTVWCIADGNLMRFENGIFTAILAPADSLKPKSAITQIAVDRNGVVWTDGITAGIIDAIRNVLCFDGVKWKTVPLPWPSENTTISKIVVDKRNVKWFATDSGLVRLEGESAAIWQVDGPPHFPIWFSGVDRENVFWCIGGVSPVTFSGFDGKSWKNFANAAYGPIVVDSRNRKWFNKYNGLIYYDGNVWSKVKTPPKPYSIWYYYLAIDKNDVVWFMANNSETNKDELGSYDGNEWKMYGNGGLDVNTAPKLVIDDSGTKWLFQSRGPVSFDGAQWKSYPEAPVPEGQSWNDMAVDQNGLKWFTFEKGVLSFDGDAWREYTKDTGFPYSAAHNVFIDRCNVKWFSTDSYLVSYDGTAWKTHNPGDGINMGWISNLAADMNNRKWIVWNSGYALSVLDDRPGADSGNIPVSLSLLGNYPNPFNVKTAIAFDLSEWGAVTLTVYDVLGRKVHEIHTGKLPMGRNTITWNGADDRGKRVSSGVYLYRLRFGGKAETGRMLFLK